MSHELVDELACPLGAIGFDGQVVERSAQLLDDGGCEVVGGDRRYIHPAAGAVTVESVGYVDLLLEVPLQREIEEGRRLAVSSIAVVRPPCTIARTGTTNAYSSAPDRLAREPATE